VRVPPGTDTNSITLNDIVWPAVSGLAHYQIYASTSDDLICLVQRGDLTAGDGLTYTPTSITITGPLPRSTLALPSPYVANVRVKAKLQRHGGVAGLGALSVADYQIVSSDAIDTSDTPYNYTGRVLSVIGRPEAPTPFASFLISAFDPATGTFTIDSSSLNPNSTLADGTTKVCQPGDAIVVRNKADAENSSTPTQITDSGYVNATNGFSGLGVNAEVGKILRVIQGTGRGQLRKITANTATQLTWDLPLLLDTTSVWIIEEASWAWQGDSAAIGNADMLQSAKLIIPVDNMREQPVVIAGFTVDVNGVESPDGNNPIREDWIFGAQGTRTITASDTQRATDGTVLVDCSNLTGDDATAGGISFQCLPAAQVPNVDLIVQKQIFDPPDGKTVWVNAAAGEAFADGSTQIVLTDSDYIAEIKFHG
jgi:hypothetical protein